MSVGSYDQARGAGSDECPGASAWNAAHTEQSAKAITERDQRRDLSDRALLVELQARVDRDQQARRSLLSAPRDSAFRQEVLEVDSQNLRWLLPLLKSQGMPTAEQVGEHGLELVWLLVQHADTAPELQAVALGEFAKRFEAREFSADSLAKLTDRVLMSKGEPQRYGTQFDWFSGRFNPKGALHASEIDKNRAELGLMPLSDYACFMNSMLQRSKNRAAQ